MPKTVNEIARELREFMDKNKRNVVTFPLDEFYTFVDRMVIKEAFEAELYNALFDLQLIYQRGASCFIVVRDYNFSRDQQDKLPAAGKRSAEQCAETVRNFLDLQVMPQPVLSMRWKPDMYQFVGRTIWRDKFTEDLQHACHAYEMQFLVGSACGIFVWDYNFASAKGELY
jgi:hypothetical protein